MRSKGSAALITLVAAAVSSADGRVQPQPPATLRHATELTCTFSASATGTWNGDDPVAQVRPATLSIAFTDIDAQDGVATSVGTFGPASIIVRFASGNLHFMQVGNSGALYVTTVFEKEVRGTRLKAVHTRHEYTDVSLPGFTSRPEQYYGDCTVSRSRPASGVP